jgi:hypothetical protein
MSGSGEVSGSGDHLAVEIRIEPLGRSEEVVAKLRGGAPPRWISSASRGRPQLAARAVSWGEQSARGERRGERGSGWDAEGRGYPRNAARPGDERKVQTALQQLLGGHNSFLICILQMKIGMVVMKGCERSVAKRTRLQHSSEFACKQQGVRAGEKVRWGREKKYPRFERSQAGIRISKMPMRELLHVLQ